LFNDGATDVPAMKMLNYQGGTSIGVYPPNTIGAKTKAKKLLKNDRANYIAKADYSNEPSTSYLKDEAKMASNSLAMEVPSIISLVPEEII
jgi:hypothetical protein